MYYEKKNATYTDYLYDSSGCLRTEISCCGGGKNETDGG